MPNDLRSLSTKELKRRLAALRAGTDEKASGTADPAIPSIQRRMAIDANKTAGIGKQGLQTIHQDPNSPEAIALRQARAVALGLREAPGVTAAPTGATPAPAVDPGFYRKDNRQVMNQLERQGQAFEGGIGKPGMDLEEIKRRLRKVKINHTTSYVRPAKRNKGASAQSYEPNG